MPAALALRASRTSSSTKGLRHRARTGNARPALRIVLLPENSPYRRACRNSRSGRCLRHTRQRCARSRPGNEHTNRLTHSPAPTSCRMCDRSSERLAARKTRLGRSSDPRTAQDNATNRRHTRRSRRPQTTDHTRRHRRRTHHPSRPTPRPHLPVRWHHSDRCQCHRCSFQRLNFRHPALPHCCRPPALAVCHRSLLHCTRRAINTPNSPPSANSASRE